MWPFFRMCSGGSPEWMAVSTLPHLIKQVAFNFENLPMDDSHFSEVLSIVLCLRHNLFKDVRIHAPVT